MKLTTGRLVLDEHVARVVEFMERNIPADRLEYVAERLPSLATVIWGKRRCAVVEHLPVSDSQSNANESCLAGTYVGDDSAAAAGACERT